MNSELTRKDANGTIINKVSSSVYDVHVDGYKFSVKNENDTVNIQIGDPDITVTGEKVYRISYKLGFSNDGISDFDEVYYNIIGLDWPTSIEHLTFSVTLPKSFDAEKLGFSIGSKGTTGYRPEDLSFNVDGNTVTGTVLRQLSPYMAVTMRVELPQGYFRVPDLRLPDWIIMGVIGLLSLISVLLVLIFGLDEKPVNDVDFYSLEGITPAEVGYILSGNIADRDVISLLIYWADKGYLTIIEEDRNIELHKVKDMGKEAKSFERHMFIKLFQKGPSVAAVDLEYSFYKTIESVKSMIKLSFDKDDRHIFTKTSMKIRPYISLMLLLPVIITLAFSMTKIEMELAVVIILSIIFGVILLIPFFFFIGLIRRWRSTKPKSRKIKLFFALLFSFIAFGGFLWITLNGAKEPALPWSAVLATFIMGFCSTFIRKRTPFSLEWLGKIQGFKDYLEGAGFKKMMEQDSGYFYHVLPYAYVLNLTDRLPQNLDTIVLSPPQWYTGYGSVFSIYLFFSFFNRTMSTFQDHMTSMPSSGGSSSSGGGSGFSGGSSSGGGGGGGGGGAW